MSNIRTPEMVAGKNLSLKVQAFRGASAPPLFVALLIIASSLQPNYNQVSQLISELGYYGASNPAILDFDLLLTGFLIILFSLGLRHSVEGGTSSYGPWLAALAGISLAAAGFFPGNPDIPSGGTHGILAILTFVSFVVSPLLTARILRTDRRWQDLYSFNRATAIILLALFVSYFVFAYQGPLMPWRGALERGVFAVPLLWIEVMAIRSLRLL
jgi:hypothetical membrane protein